MTDATQAAPLTHHTYLPLARRTLKELPYKEHLRHMALGYCGEVGELLDAIKKSAIYGKPLDKVNLAEEIGDVAWYVINLVPDLGFSTTVLDKLPPFLGPDGTTLNDMDPVDFMLAINVLCAGFGFMSVAETPDPGSEAALEMLQTLYGGLVAMSTKFEIPLDVIFEANIAKLQKRYGEEYSDFAALNRDLEGERTVLEGSTLVHAADVAR